jgi:hypothetical protein
MISLLLALSLRAGYHKSPYLDRNDDEVIQLYPEGNPPPVDLLGAGDVIAKCWDGSHENAGEVLRDLVRSSLSFCSWLIP